MSNITPELQRALVELLECVPPQKLSRTIRNLMMEYIITQKDTDTDELRQSLDDLINLFRFLDTLEAEQIKSTQAMSIN